MTFVPEPELYSFMLRGYHLFSERLPSAWIGDINHIIDEMYTSDFDQFRYSKVTMEPMYDWDGKTDPNRGTEYHGSRCNF